VPAPAAVVLQELFGVNADIREKCGIDRTGFHCSSAGPILASKPGVDLEVRLEADWQHGLRLYQAYNRGEGVEDIKDTIETVAKVPECTGKIAVLGYCLGALMAFLTAVRHRVDAAVAYHGGDTEKYLGEEDEFISKPAQAAIEAALAEKPSATVYSYPE
jgi:carboxymethylenebutenolidase